MGRASSLRTPAVDLITTALVKRDLTCWTMIFHSSEY
jgi:hypothetical protein